MLSKNVAKEFDMKFHTVKITTIDIVIEPTSPTSF